MTSRWSGYLNGIDADLSEEERDTISKHLTHVDARKSESTLRNHKSSLKGFAEYLDNVGIPLFDVSALDIEDWVNTLLADDYAPRSVRVKCYAVSAVYQTFQKRGFVGENPIEEADGISDLSATRLEQHRDEEYLTLDEYKKLRDAADTLRDRLVIELLWNTGVRVSEAVNIRISDIDRDERSIEITSAKTNRHATPESRTVYYSRSFGRTLKAWLDGGGRARYPGAHGDHDYLLVSSHEDQMGDARPSKIVRETADEAGIQEVLYTDRSGRDRNRVHAHLLRKSYGVHRIRSDTGGGSMPLPYLQELMGHDDISTTRDRYLRFRQDDVKEAERNFSPRV